MSAGAGALSPQVLQAMHAASALLQAGNFAQARAVLEQIVRSNPRFVEAHRLLGGALQALGDLAGAERSLRLAVQLDPHWAPAQIALGEWLSSAGRFDEAETAFRAALSSASSDKRALFGLAQILTRSGRAKESTVLLAPLAASSADAAILTEYANALTASGDATENALSVYARAVEVAPTSGIVEYNLASALENSGRHAEAKASTKRARAKGFDVAQTWFVSGCAALGENEFDAAEADFREAIRRDAGYVEAHRELSQLIWMRSADTAAATADLDRSIARSPNLEALLRIKSMLLASAGKGSDALASVASFADSPRASAETLLVAADVALTEDAESAVRYAERAIALAPQEPAVQRTLGSALLAANRAEAAASFAEKILAARPDDQHLLAIRATAWRLLGDPRYRGLYDYDAFVSAQTIDTPPGWPDLSSYIADLAKSLRKLHGLRTHPIGQSLRHGTQTTQNLMLSDDPAIRAIFAAIDGPIRRHMNAIGHGSDPLRRRNTGAYRIKGIWSVQLQPNGFHTNHTHPEGWLSSACYVDVPDSVAQNHDGWLKLGEPGVPTHPRLPPEHFVKPEPGRLALFPAYMWHGTVPFSGDKPRLTFAFDVVPA